MLNHACDLWFVPTPYWKGRFETLGGDVARFSFLEVVRNTGIIGKIDVGKHATFPSWKQRLQISGQSTLLVRPILDLLWPSPVEIRCSRLLSDLLRGLQCAPAVARPNKIIKEKLMENSDTKLQAPQYGCRSSYTVCLIQFKLAVRSEKQARPPLGPIGKVRPESRNGALRYVLKTVKLRRRPLCTSTLTTSESDWVQGTPFYTKSGTFQKFITQCRTHFISNTLCGNHDPCV